MKEFTKKFLKSVWPIMLAIVIVMTIPLGLLCKGYFDFKEDLQHLKQVATDAQQEIDEGKENALKAYHDGYDFYLNGILLDSENLLIDSLLEYSVVVSINHEERYIELKD